MTSSTVKKAIYSVVVALLFAPIILSSGSPAFRPAWFTDRYLGLPASTWTVVVLIAVFVLLVVWFSWAAFDEASDAKGEDRS